ncbi:MAG: hypothetical protein EA405_11370 [Rhodospirillales bacterium]|nr:MAG: hypothetical protein EA405_11370 [Rhodospirillales bacterium]
MSVHHYPFGAMAGDYARATLGLGLVGLPLAFGETAPPVTALLAAASVLFVIYALITVRRHVTRLEITDAGIRTLSPGTRPGVLAWQDIKRLTLCHYSTRRDRSGGWLQLRLKGGGGSLCIDSRLEDFDRIAARASAAARCNGLNLDHATAHNLQRLGLEPAADHDGVRW